MALPLTAPDPDLDLKQRSTIPGMAFWAGTGPAGRSCGECQSFKEISWGIGKTTRCGRYEKMMGRNGPKKLPKETRSCKYFEPK